MPGFGRYCSLEGHDATPSHVLDGTVDNDTVTVIPESSRKRAASDCVPNRPILAVMTLAGSSCLMSFVTQLVFGLRNVTMSQLLGLVVAPAVVVTSTAIVLMKMFSVSDEIDVQNVLVSGGNHLVHVSSCLIGAGERTTNPLMEIRMTHVIVRHGTATRTIGGFSFSHAETYLMRVPVSTLQKANRVTIPRSALVSKGQGYIPDLFEVSLCTLLGDWPRQSDWMWAMPMCGDEKVASTSEAIAKMVPTDDPPVETGVTDGGDGSQTP